MPGATGIIGYYHPHGYNIWTMENGRLEDQIYEAGNNPADSSSMIGLRHAESVENLREFCDRTGREFSGELGLPYLGCDREADPFETEV